MNLNSILLETNKFSYCLTVVKVEFLHPETSQYHLHRLEGNDTGSPHFHTGKSQPRAFFAEFYKFQLHTLNVSGQRFKQRNACCLSYLNWILCSVRIF